ncbi:PD-(D/E)XK motif protein, partial [Candidatus Binatia bacterium]|nr:PD-(D/E)XK motif protein [Candidatus Binatia bacterium]
LELEVKTTVSSSRRHQISSLQQLKQSDGFTLYLVSVLLGKSADGRTLPELVNQVRGLVPEGRRGELDQQLEHYGRAPGYRDDHALFYNQRLIQRRPIAAIPVDGNLPAFNSAIVADLFGKHAAERLLEMSYKLDLEGLGWEDTSPSFVRRLPMIAPIGKS